MKFLDFASLLSKEPAQIAFLSTFQFDPEHFERRLSRCSTLAKARRIVVFMDARQWYDLLRRDVPARRLNRHYLVVPVARASGVFHPKLHLILAEGGGQVLCGSNNLTRSGCTSNLELLNAVPFDINNFGNAERALAKNAFSFFKTASTYVEEGIRRILDDWLSETEQIHPWLKESSANDDQGPQLLHTYEGSIWKRLVEVINPLKPKEFLICSPFHDQDADICSRLIKQWPSASVEFLVQQGYTNLPVERLTRMPRLRLSELSDSSRRLHAKFIAWKTAKGSGCLVGSANFTSAALDARNVEACLLLSDADGLVDALFDQQFAKTSLALKDFEPGQERAPEDELGKLPDLRIKSAILDDSGQLVVRYSYSLDYKPSSLRLAIRAPGEPRPRTSVKIPIKSEATTTIPLPEDVLADAHGTLLASLIAEIGEKREESLPVWIIQESRLTKESGEGTSSSKSKIEETGEGLPEFIDELGSRNGVAAVIDYLRHLNIRFDDGGSSGPSQRKFSLRVRDPYHPDAPPEWLLKDQSRLDDLAEAIYDFVDRHDQRRLQKHASRGNINGIENFLDIFTTLIRLLYVYYTRGIVKKPMLVGRVCRFLRLATIGKDTEEEVFDGYLYSVFESLDGDVDTIRKVCDEVNYVSQIRAALLIAQLVRFTLGEVMQDGSRPTRQREVLQSYEGTVEEAIKKCGLYEPKPEAIRLALEGYRMFSDFEIALLLRELPGELASTTPNSALQN